MDPAPLCLIRRFDTGDIVLSTGLTRVSSNRVGQRDGVGRIHATFERLRQGRAKALIPFLMGGDPDLRTTGELIRTVADAGADLIEVGVPFSDPLADGPTIQRASQRSLEHGTTPPKLFDALARVSRQIPVPLVLLTYWNPLVRYGNGTSAVDPTPFLRQARRAGICGIVVPDLPPEEAEALKV